MGGAADLVKEVGQEGLVAPVAGRLVWNATPTEATDVVFTIHTQDPMAPVHVGIYASVMTGAAVATIKGQLLYLDCVKSDTEVQQGQLVARLLDHMRRPGQKVWAYVAVGVQFSQILIHRLFEPPETEEAWKVLKVPFGAFVGRIIKSPDENLSSLEDYRYMFPDDNPMTTRKRPRLSQNPRTINQAPQRKSSPSKRDLYMRTVD